MAKGKGKFGGLFTPDSVYKGEINELRSEIAHMQKVLERAQAFKFPPTGLTDAQATVLMRDIIAPMHGWLISMIETYFALVLLVQMKRGLGAAIETATFMMDVQNLHKVFEPVTQSVKAGPISGIVKKNDADAMIKAIMEGISKMK